MTSKRCRYLLLLFSHFFLPALVFSQESPELTQKIQEFEEIINRQRTLISNQKQLSTRYQSMIDQLRAEREELLIQLQAEKKVADEVVGSVETQLKDNNDKLNNMQVEFQNLQENLRISESAKQMLWEENQRIQREINESSKLLEEQKLSYNLLEKRYDDQLKVNTQEKNKRESDKSGFDKERRDLLRSFDRERVQLKRELAELERKLRVATREQKQSVIELVRKKADLSKEQEDNERIEKNYQNTVKQYQAVQQTVEELLEKIRQKDKTINELQRNLTSEVDWRKNMERQFQALKQKFEAQQRAYESQLLNKDKSIQQFEAKIVDLHNDYQLENERWEARFASLNQKRLDLSNEIELLNNKVGEYEDKEEVNRQTIGQLKQQLDNEKEQVNKEKQLLAQTRNDWNVEKNEKQRLIQEIRAMEQRKGIMDKALQEKSAEIRQLEQNIVNLTNSIRELNKDKNYFVDEGRQKETKIKSLETRVATSSQREQNLMQQNQEMKATIDNKQRELRESQQEIKTLTNELTEMHAKNEVNRSSVKQMREDLDKYIDVLAQTKKERDDLLRQWEQAEKDKQSLVQQLKLTVNKFEQQLESKDRDWQKRIDRLIAQEKN